MNSTAGIFTASSERKSEKTLCRLCMKDDDYYYNIFTSNVARRITVKDALNGLLGLVVAVGDGLPTTLCPRCLKKLTELSAFKSTCLESDVQLRKFSGISCFRSIQGDQVADDEWGSSADTKDCIQDEIESTSHLTCSVQRTEIYIPVPDPHQSRANMLVTVKDENKDPLSEGNYPEMNTPDPAGIPSNALDPLETDDLSGMGTCGSPSVKADQFSDDVGRCALNASTNGATNDLMFQASDQAEASTSSQSEEVDAKGTGAMEIDLDSMQVLAKKELSPKETDATEPTIMENGGVIHNRTMAMESIMEAMDTLRGMQAINDPKNASVTRCSKLIGDEVVGSFFDILNEFKFEEVEELFSAGESDNLLVPDDVTGILGEERSSDDSSPTDHSEYEPSPKRSTHQHIPLDVKVKVVNMAKEHPKWSLATLQTLGSVHLKHKGMLAICEKDIKSGGTKRDKLEMIDRWVYDRFVEARNMNEPVMTRTLQEWAISLSFQHISQEFEFFASASWVASGSIRRR
ncbi:uncharacterized protein LOC124172041 [Ischnura elegans]|uniref:uncharacterized protein LOC124172041 n=1 Tax=Ischnura elegans TaxID=197161 RepID=UPI001ED87DE4|nr:uncharacterized protein LOC124172041 [Ischnura elegans]